MLDQEDLKWIASASTQLNSTVQQISRYADLARRHKGEHHYLNLLDERVELASKTAQALLDRVTTRTLEDASAKTKSEQIKFTRAPSPSATMPSRADEMITTEPGVESEKAQNGSAALGIPSTARVKNLNGNREYLLLIEDEPDVAEITSELLAEEGYKVIIAHDGFEALKTYQSAGQQIRLVILDFFLPIMDGDEVFDELRAINPNVNVVLSSGFAEQTKVRALLARGLRGFIPKPYTGKRLIKQVRSALDAARGSSC